MRSAANWRPSDDFLQFVGVGLDFGFADAIIAEVVSKEAIVGGHVDESVTGEIE